MREKQCVRIDLQNRVRNVASDIVEVVMNSFGSEGGIAATAAFTSSVLYLVVDGEVEAALQEEGMERVITGNAGDEDGRSASLKTSQPHLVFHKGSVKRY